MHPAVEMHLKAMQMPEEAQGMAQICSAASVPVPVNSEGNGQYTLAGYQPRGGAPSLVGHRIVSIVLPTLRARGQLKVMTLCQPGLVKLQTGGHGGLAFPASKHIRHAGRQLVTLRLPSVRPQSAGQGRPGVLQTLAVASPEDVPKEIGVRVATLTRKL